MSISPIITFKAGKCDVDFNKTPPRISPRPAPGYIYLYGEDDLIHFCWRTRAASLEDPEIDLVMVPTDGTFKPYLGPEKVITESGPKSPVNGRIFVLRFSSTSQRYFFWLQSKEQPKGSPSQFSPRDLRLGHIVDNLLQGGDAEMNDDNGMFGESGQEGGGGNNDDATMEDAQPEHLLDGSASGGAGAGATGGDFRDEGETPREGGADGGRADTTVADQTSTAVRDFLNSLQAGNVGTLQQNKPLTTLPDLLPASTTIPIIDGADSSFLEDLLVRHLPPTLLLVEHQVEDMGVAQVDPETATAFAEALSDDQKKNILRRVLRSPQFHQGLGTLTAALRDGGLPTISGALGIEVENGGYTQPGGQVPISGGNAVQVFLNGIRRLVEKKDDEKQAYENAS